MTTINTNRAAQELAESILKSGGGTVSIVSGVRPPTNGYVVSLAGAEYTAPFSDPGSNINHRAATLTRLFHEIGAYADAHRDQLAQPGMYLGAWIYNGTLYLDVSEHFAERIPALFAGRERAQLAIYDIAAGESISLDSGPTTEADDSDLTALLDSLSWEELAAADSGVTWNRPAERDSERDWPGKSEGYGACGELGCTRCV